MTPLYLLDTTVLLHWTRGKSQAEALDRQFNLNTSPQRPLVCEVSLGELLSFSRNPQWSERQRERMLTIERHVTPVDISNRRLLEAYADISTLAQASGWSLFHGKNDLWIAAAAAITGAHLLTMDKDFEPLQNRADWRVTLLDIHTALPLGS